MTRVLAAYTLGYRDQEGTLHGLRQGPDGDTLPILSDRPQVVVHGRGFNVLFISGAVRYSTSHNIGVNGDDIFVNDAFKVRAGLHRDDSVLATGDTAP